MGQDSTVCLVLYNILMENKFNQVMDGGTIVQMKKMTKRPMLESLHPSCQTIGSRLIVAAHTIAQLSTCTTHVKFTKALGASYVQST